MTDRSGWVGVGAIALVAAVSACSSAHESHQPTPSPVPSAVAVMTPAPPSDSVKAATLRSLVVNDAAAANPALAEATVSVGGRERTVMLPKGLGISVLASGLSGPRFMAFDEAGNLLVAARGAGAVYRYPKGAGTTRPPAPLIPGLHAPTSLAFHDGYLYVGEDDRVTRFRYTPTGPVGGAEPVLEHLPTAGHSTKTVAFGPDGKLYVSMGSSCNICEESDERRAAVMRYNPDGTGYERFAWGLRNAVGLAFRSDGELWVTVNERDRQGNEIPPDLVTRVAKGQNFGWPDCQPPNATPQTPSAVCTGVTPPTIGIQPHSAPLGLAFATGQLPAPYDEGLFVVQHGSWNRQPPAAPKLLHITFDAAGQPTAVRDFATGWQESSGHRWGRPAGIVVAPDGALIVSDDNAGVLYRIAPKGN